MEKVKVTQTKSIIGASKRQKLTMQALGIKRMGRTIEHNATDSVKGMINAVKHLVTVEYVK
jgi:large subunit ribosomal protein L30